MNSYKLVIAYDGTAYHGWQWQENAITVDAVIRKTFLRVFRQSDMHIVGASRTDAGVHAYGQVIRIGTVVSIDPQKLQRVLNDALPSDILVRECSLIDPASRFHPQHDIKSKTYSYRFFLERPDPMVQRYGYYIHQKMDAHKLAHALTLFVGTYDFRAFCKESADKDTTRTIESIALEPCKRTGGYQVIIKGSSFLRYMIRRIVGACIAIACDTTRSTSELKRLLEVPSLVVKNLPTAPSKGLCLESIDYIEDVG